MARTIRYIARLCVSVALLCVMPVAVSSAGPFDPGEFIEIVGAHLEGRLDEDPASGYNQVIDAILPSDDYLYRFQRYPVLRGLRQFTKLRRACIFPASEKSVRAFIGDMPLELLESTVIDRVSAHLITRRDMPAIVGFDELEGKRIVAQGGVGIGQFIPAGVDYTLTTTPDDASALKMLNAGRIDVMYGFYPDIILIAEKNGIELPHFKPDLVLFETTTHLVCKSFEGAADLINKVNIRTQNLKDTGRLKDLLSKYAQIVYE